MNANRVVVLVGGVLLLLLGGCVEADTKAWEERQRVLLEKYLDRPGVSYGEIVINAAKKEWTINDYSVTLEYDDFPGKKYAIKTKTMTGTGVELEPVSDVGLLAQKMVSDGVTMDLPGTEYVAVIDRLVVENLTGGPDVQRNLLGFENGVFKRSLYGTLSYGWNANGVTVAGPRGQWSMAVGHMASKMQTLESMGPLMLTDMTVSFSSPGLHSLTIGEIFLEKATMDNYAEFLALLEEKNLTVAEVIMNSTVGREMLPFMVYAVHGFSAKKIALFIREDLPPVTLGELRADLDFEKGENSEAWHFEDLGIVPELLRSLIPYPLLSNYPFPAYSFSGDLDFVVHMDGAKIERVRLNSLALREPSLGGIALKADFGISVPASCDAVNDAKEPGMDCGGACGAFVANDPSGGTEGHTPECSGERPGNKAVISDGFSYAKNVHLAITDKNLLRASFSIASVMTGMAGSEDAGAGGDMLRYAMALSVNGQCEQYTEDIKKACLETSRFLSKGGTIEYSFGVDRPLLLDHNPLEILKETDITSVYTPLSE